MTGLRNVAIAGCALSLLAGVALGQFAQPDETLPGFKANDVYFSGTYDHVSAFNGDDGVVIPLGPSYKLGADFDFQLKAFNSLKLWYFKDGDTCAMQIDGSDKNVTEAYVNGFPTIGAAWTLSPGYVMTDTQPTPVYTYIYVSPDGGHHPAYADGVTIDNSRLKIGCSPSPNWTSCTVNFPDGTKQTFDQPLPDPAPTGISSPDFNMGNPLALGLRKVEDAWGREMMNVTYGSPGWEVSKIYLSATQSGPQISFSWTSASIPATGGSVTWPVLDTISFPVIGASPAQTVKFLYQTTGFSRSGADTTLANAPCPCQTQYQDTPTAYVPQISSISIYNGSVSLANLAGMFSMQYTDARGGVLTNLTLPMGGKIAYTIGPAQHAAPDGPTWPDLTLETNDRGLGDEPILPPVPGCPPNHLFISELLGDSAAVISRTETDPVSGVASTTTFNRFDNVPTSYPTLNQTLGGYDSRVVEVLEPKDQTAFKMTRYMFHLDTSEDPTLSGVELEHSIFDGGTLSGSPVRTDIQCIDLGSTTGSCGYLTTDGMSVNSFTGSDAHPSGHVLWYGAKPTGATDKSGGTCPSGSSTPCVSERSSPASGWTQTSGYHYPTETTTSANTTPTVNRTTTTTWNACTSAWVLDPFTTKVATDVSGGVSPTSVTSNFTFESCKPFIQSVSTVDSNTLTLSATDSGLGKPTPIVRSGTGMGLSGSFTDSYAFDANGHALTDQRTSVPFLSFNATRDLSTGLVTTSKDPNLIQTSYTYDALGRLTVISPPAGEAATQYCYLLNTDGNLNNYNPAHLNLVYIKRGSTAACQPNETSSSVTWEAYQYDGLGRVIREFNLLPNNLGGTSASDFAIRDTNYDAAGNKAFVSEWTPCNATGASATTIGYCAIGISTQHATTGTTYAGFDVFGRPSGTNAITRADGTTTNITYTDGSILASDLYEAVTINNVGGATALTITRKDPLGRVYSVVEPAVGGIADTTTYGYNVLDKLACVLQGTGTFVPCTASTGQARAFVYDALGFLRSETNPEDGTTGNGTTGYTVYDALGDVLTKTDGGVTYTSQFDAAGRSTTLKADSDATSIFNYYDGNGFAGGSYPKGHLTERIGWNMGIYTTPASVVPVTEKFTYGNSTGANGRVTAIETLVGDLSGDLRTDQTLSLAYNSLGLVQTRTHPVVSGTALTETITFGNGLPTSISTNLGTPVWTSSATYNPAGGLASWRAASSTGVLTTIAPNVIPTRPSSILTSDSGFNTGTYAYDGAGNILNMTKDASNADTFTYDARSRLTNASYKVAGVTSSQGYSYDRFGNLLGTTGTGARTLTTSATTNRLTSGSYDARGNLIAFAPESLLFDKLNRQVDDQGITVEWGYAYSGAGERTAKLQVANLVARREMAVEIAQSRGDSPATGCVTPHFPDVPCSDPDWGYIQDLYLKGIVNGYGDGTYGPEDPVRRDTMAAFVSRSLNYPNAAPVSGTVNGTRYNCVLGGSSYFHDVQPTDQFCADIHYIASLTPPITQGCDGVPDYCPATLVPEAQMMAFMQRGWGSYHPVPRGTRYTLRDEANRVINESTDNVLNGPTAANLVTTRDNIFLGNLLVATYVSSTIGGGNAGWTYFHSDHLGTPRHLSNLGGGTGESGDPKYWPYGDEFTVNNTSQKLRFATMERDLENNHYYDHARPHDFNLGRFVSVDKHAGSPGQPGSWNRYRYANDDPLNYLDPDGKGSFAVGFGIAFHDDRVTPQAQFISGMSTAASHPAVQFLIGITALAGGAIEASPEAIFSIVGGGILAGANDPEHSAQTVVTGGLVSAAVSPFEGGFFRSLPTGFAISAITQKLTAGAIDWGRAALMGGLNATAGAAKAVLGLGGTATAAVRVIYQSLGEAFSALVTPTKAEPPPQQQKPEDQSTVPNGPPFGTG